MLDLFKPSMHPALPQEDRRSRQHQKQKMRRLSSSPQGDSANSSPAPPVRKPTNSRSSNTQSSSSKRSTLSRNLSRRLNHHDSAAESTVDSVPQTPSGSSTSLTEQDTAPQHDTRSGAIRSGFHKFKNSLGFSLSSKSTSVRGMARTKEEALQGQKRTGSRSGLATSVRRPSRRRSSSSKTPPGTVTPGEYMHAPPQSFQPPPATYSAYGNENMHPTVNIPVSGGQAARAAAADANSRRKIERRDSQTGMAETTYTRGNRDSGLNMSSDNEMDVTYDDPRRVCYGKARNPLKEFPFEISVQVFGLLDAQDLKNTYNVSHAWRNISRDPHVWRHAFQQSWETPQRSNELPLAVGGKGIGKPEQFNQDWPSMYQARQQIEQNWKDGRAMGTYLNGHTDSVYCTQFDEKYIYTGSRDRTIRIWDMQTLQCLRVIGIPSALHNDRLHRSTPNPNNTLPILSPNSPMKCNPNPPGSPDPSIYHTPRIYHDASILCLQLDDEIAITGSSDNTLIMWDVKTWEPIRRLVKHSAGVLDVAFDKEKIVSCSKDSTLCVWDRRTGDLLQQIASHRGPVNAVQLRGQFVVSASGEGCARLWNLNYKSATNLYTNEIETTVSPVMQREFWSKERGLACIEFSDDGKYVLAGGNDMQIFKYDAATGALLKEMKAHSNLVRSLYLDEAGGRIISGSYDSVIRVWDMESGEMRKEFLGWTGSWMLSAKADFRRIVATSQDSRALVLDFGYGVNGVELLTGA